MRLHRVCSINRILLRNVTFLPGRRTTRIRFINFHQTTFDFPFQLVSSYFKISSIPAPGLAQVSCVEMMTAWYQVKCGKDINSQSKLVLGLDWSHGWSANKRTAVYECSQLSVHFVNLQVGIAIRIYQPHKDGRHCWLIQHDGLWKVLLWFIIIVTQSMVLSSVKY